jgi:uncharacterized membrane protein YhaH (DUF805 family)
MEPGQGYNGPFTVRWALFGFQGRIGRQSYILGALLMLTVIFFTVARLLAVQGDEGASAFWGLAFLMAFAAAAWSNLALTIKRLHDINQPGALVVLLFVPTINFFFVVFLMAMPSHPRDNEHGAPPFPPSDPGGGPDDGPRSDPPNDPPKSPGPERSVRWGAKTKR